MVKHTQTICWTLPTNCLSVFDHFVGLVLKGLSIVTLPPHQTTTKLLSAVLIKIKIWCYETWHAGNPIASLWKHICSTIFVMFLTKFMVGWQFLYPAPVCGHWTWTSTGPLNLVILVKIFWNNVTCIKIVTYIFYYRVAARTELWNCSYINKVNRVIFAFALWLFQWILKLAYGRHQIFGNVITKSLEQQRKVFVITKFVLQDDY